MKKALTVFLLLFLSSALWAQDIQSASLKWSVSQLNDLSTGSIKAYTCDFKTSSAQEIIWVQKSITYDFLITDIIGTWPDVQISGEITYEVLLDGESGTLAFKRTNSGVFITLDLSQAGGPRLRRSYSVSAVSSSN